MTDITISSDIASPNGITLLGITGRAGAGKDTLARYMIEEGESRGLRVVRRGFADLLKVSAARALGYEGSRSSCVEFMDAMKTGGLIRYCYCSASGGPWDEWKTAHVRGREYLQNFGTEAHRDLFGQDFWVDALFPPNDWTRNVQGADVAIVTDVRFPNEARRIREHGFVIELVRREASERADSHASELPLARSLIDETFVNEHDLVMLRYKAAGVLSWLQHRVSVPA